MPVDEAKLPGRHELQTVTPALLLNVPLGHAEQFVTEVRPGVTENVPAAHDWHRVAAVSPVLPEKVPVRQSVQTAAPVDEKNLPA